MPLRMAPSMATLAVLESALTSLRISKPVIGVTKRYASHASQGRANKATQGPGKRLGAKKTSGAYVVPGNILFKQRGTLWFPGENCYMGRDHTIHAGQPGYVRYYRDPAVPKRKFIGIALEKDHILPKPAIAARRRLLGMLAYKMKDEIEAEGTPDLVKATDGVSQVPNEYRVRTKVKTVAPNKYGPDVPRKEISTLGPSRALRPGYQYREANWEIGRAGERAEAAANAKGRTTRTLPDFKVARNVVKYRQRVAELRKRNTVTQGKQVRAAKNVKKRGRKR